jgi:hypothetical protein
MGAIIELPLAISKKLDNTENLPYQWFGEVWKLMNTNKLDLSDNIIQDIFIAQGKGKQAQKDFYLKYGECKPEAKIIEYEEEGGGGDHEVWKRGKHEVWDEEFFAKRQRIQKTRFMGNFLKFMFVGIITIIILVFLIAIMIIR